MHSHTEPVYIEGAKPGDVLEVRVIDIKLNDLDYNFLNPSAGIFDNLPKPQIKYFKFDKEPNTTEFSPDLPIKPFPGFLALTPLRDRLKEWPIDIDTLPAQPVKEEFNSAPRGPLRDDLDQPELQTRLVLFVLISEKEGFPRNAKQRRDRCRYSINLRG